MHMRQKQSKHFIQIKQGHTTVYLSSQKYSDYTRYMGKYYYYYGGHLEKLIGRRLHDICSSFINKVIIAIVGVRVGVVDDDVVLRASAVVVFSSSRGKSHKYF